MQCPMLGTRAYYGLAGIMFGAWHRRLLWAHWNTIGMEFGYYGLAGIGLGRPLQLPEGLSAPAAPVAPGTACCSCRRDR